MKSRTLTTLGLLASAFALRGEHEIARIDKAKEVFDEIMQTPDKGIPRDLLADAHCIAIIPGAKRAGFIVGGQYGVGVAQCRNPKGAGWTGPSTVRIEGGSFGLQIGGGETDIVFLVMNDDGARELMKSEFTLGGEAGAMAGPVGRTVTAETDAFMHAKILSYSRSRGIFGGIALKGSTLRSDDDANRVIYGKSVRHEDILQGKVPGPASAKGLVAQLNRYSMRESGSATPAGRDTAKHVSSGERTLVGCLAHEGEGFILKTKSQGEVAVMGSDVSAKHSGHTVELTGTMKKDHGKSTLDVTKLKHVANSCQS